MPVASVQFIKKNKYDLRAAIGHGHRRGAGGADRGLAGVVTAAQRRVVRVLVLVVILYTAFTHAESGGAGESDRRQACGGVIH